MLIAVNWLLTLLSQAKLLFQSLYLTLGACCAVQGLAFGLACLNSFGVFFVGPGDSPVDLLGAVLLLVLQLQKGEGVGLAW